MILEIIRRWIHYQKEWSSISEAYPDLYYSYRVPRMPTLDAVGRVLVLPALVLDTVDQSAPWWTSFPRVYCDVSEARWQSSVFRPKLQLSGNPYTYSNHSFNTYSNLSPLPLPWQLLTIPEHGVGFRKLWFYWIIFIIGITNYSLSPSGQMCQKRHVFEYVCALRTVKVQSS